MVFGFGMPGPWEMGLVLIIVLILFGAGRLPQVFEAFGKGIKQFRDAQKEDGPDDEAVAELTESAGVDEALEVAKDVTPAQKTA
jgi:sec-independent protein translocase protein TatA